MVLKSEKRELYIYTTELYSERGFLKVGDSKLGRYKERIREQFGTSNPEQPIIIGHYELPEGKRDHNIHHQLIANGIEKVEESPGNEWFKCTPEDVRKAFSQVCHGSTRTNFYKPRVEQLEAISKAIKWFNKDYPEHIIDGAYYKDRFLLNAKMRFGKCFTGVLIAKSLAAKNTLIITYKPEVISEWMETVNDHIEFEGWLGIRARKNSNNYNEPVLSDNGDLPSHSGPQVVCVSLQDLSINADGSTKKRLRNIIEMDWDLIIFDEVHFGSRTERAKFIIENEDEHKGLKWTKRLDLSGTPFRLIQEEDFCAEQVFTYSYLDEHKKKKNEIYNDPNGENDFIYRVMPDLDVSTIEITDEDIQSQRETFFTEDLDFSLNKLFEVKSGKFNNEEAVDHFIDGLQKRTHDARAISVFGTLGDRLGVPVKRHSVWWLGRVSSVKALAGKLKVHPYFSNFDIINAAGCDNAETDEEEDLKIVKDKQEIKRKIQKADKDTSRYGTITLTVKRFLTGVTINEWESILVLNDVESPETYFQAIFRVQSAWVDKQTGKILKPKAWVFDFAISRCLRLTFHYADALADQLDQQDSVDRVQNDNIQMVADGLCDSLEIKRFYEGNLKSDRTKAQDIFEAINFTGSRLSLAKRITSDTLVDFASLVHLEAHPDLLEALKKVKGYRTQEVGGIEEFLQIGLQAKEIEDKKKKHENDEEKAAKNEKFVNEGEREIKSRKRWFATQIKRLAICMADFIYMTQFREHKIDHVIQTKDSDFFKTVTGIDKDAFKKLCDLGFINTIALNRIVREFRCQEESSLSPEEFILKRLGNNDKGPPPGTKKSRVA